MNFFLVRSFHVHCVFRVLEKRNLVIKLMMNFSGYTWILYPSFPFKEGVLPRKWAIERNHRKIWNIFIISKKIHGWSCCKQIWAEIMKGTKNKVLNHTNLQILKRWFAKKLRIQAKFALNRQKSQSLKPARYYKYEGKKLMMKLLYLVFGS